jgi:hypothetical protein
LDLEVDFYLIGIDASIREGNHDRDLISDGMILASNDPAILLRSLMLNIQDFEFSRLNEVNVKETIENIENKGIATENKIHEKFKDICMYNENKENLKQCYLRYIYLCKKKRIEPDIAVRNEEEDMKNGYFWDCKKENEQESCEENERGQGCVKENSLRWKQKLRNVMGKCI